MPIMVRCERCGQRYQVADQMAGRSLACKGCGATMGVPAAGDHLDLGGAPAAAANPFASPNTPTAYNQPAAPFGAAPAYSAPPASPYGQPAPYNQAPAYGSPPAYGAQPHQPTNANFGYQYPGPTPTNSPYLNGPAPLSQPAGFDLPGLPTVGIPPRRSTADGANVVPYVVGAVAIGLTMFVAAAFMLLGRNEPPSVANLGAEPRPGALGDPQPRPKVGGPLGAPNHTPANNPPPAAPKNVTVAPPSGVGDLGAPATVAQGEQPADKPKTPAGRANLGAASKGGEEEAPPVAGGGAPTSSGFAMVAGEGNKFVNEGGGPMISNLGWDLELPESVPAWDFKKNWRGGVVLPRAGVKVAFADEGSPMIAFQSTWEKAPWEVWNLATMKKVATWDGAELLEDEGIVSPSGKKVAAQYGGKTNRPVRPARPARTPRAAAAAAEKEEAEAEEDENAPARPRLPSGFGEKSMLVVDVGGGKLLNSFPCGHWTKPLHFLGEDYLLCQDGWEKLTVYDLAQGQEAYEIPGHFENEPGEFAIVPGGKYFITHLEDRVIAYETATGARVGELRSPGFDRHWGFKGLAISWDGKELAVLYGEGKYVAAFDLATGDQTTDLYLDEAAHTPFGLRLKVSPIQWLPRREGWLINGKQVVDRESGGPVWTVDIDLTFGGSYLGPRILPNYWLLGASDRNDSAITSLPLPEDKIAKAVAAVRSGGEATDAALPPLTAAKIDAVKTFEVAANAGAWTLPVDPGADKKLLQNPLALKSPTGNIRRIEFSDENSAVMMVGCGPQDSWDFRHRGLDKSAAPSAHWVERYDVSGGRYVSKLDLPVPGDLLTVSRDAVFTAVAYGRKRDRIDVYRDKEHVVGFRPYGAVKRGPTNNRDAPNKSSQSVQWARFIGGNRLLTLNHAPRSLVLWKLPECEALFEMSVTSDDAPTFTPGGKYVIIPNAPTLDFLEVETGKIVSRLDAQPRGRKLSTAPAIHDSGTRLAAVAEDVLLVWNLENGELLGEVDIQTPTVSKLQWVGDNYLMLDDYLFDLQRRAVVWTYRKGSAIAGFNAASAPDSRAWAFIAEQQDASYVLGRTLPEREMRDMIAAQMPADRAPVFGPGSKVKLQVNFGGEQEERTRLEASLKKLAVSEGAVLSDAPDAFTLRIGGTVTKTYTQQYVKREWGLPIFGGPQPGEQVYSLTISTLECELALVNPQGQVVWSRKQFVGGFTPTPSSEKDFPRLANYHWTLSIPFFTQVRMPREVYEQPRRKITDDNEILGIGWSQWGVTGPIVQP